MKNPKSIRSFLICMILILGMISAFAQDPSQYGTPFGGVPEPRDVNMYQAHLRIFGPNGNFQSVINRLDDIRDLGINVIYLMPIYPHGTDAQSTSSPYCIKDFKAVASEYGDLNSLRQLVDGAHARGMAVILDVAINGTSWDHPWRSSHPEYYTGGQLDSYADIAALNLNNSGTRAAIKDALRYWIFAANIDGYRFDYANNPPLDFWQEINANLRSISSHDLILFAEGDKNELYNADFDMIFGVYWFYNALAGVAGGGSVSDLFSSRNNSDYTNASGSQMMVRYTGNHDSYTNNYYDVAGGARPFSLFNNHAGVIANFLVSGYMKGVPFLMSGQEVDYDKYTPWPWSDSNLDIDWSQNTSSIDEFAKILNFRKESNAIRRGTLTDYSDNNVCVFTKEYGTEKILVMVNMRNSTQNFIIPQGIDGNYTGVFSSDNHDVIGGSTWTLPAYKYYVLSSGDNGSSVNGMTLHAYGYNTIYFWNASDGSTTSWPGEAMSSEGNSWYSYTFSGATSANVIFSNNGSDQTADLSRSGDGWYMDGTWYDSEPNTDDGGDDGSTTSGVTNLGGQYYIINRKSGMAIDAADWGTTDGTNLLQWTHHGGDNQKFTFTHLGNGVYTITNVNSGLVIDVSASSTANGANVQLWSSNGSDCQKYMVIDAGGGYYQLVAQHSNKVVEVADGSTTAGANVQQWDNNDQLCSQWALTPVSSSSWSTKIEAENYVDMNGVQTEACSDTDGGTNVGYIDAGDWMVWDVNLPTSTSYTVKYRVASYSGGGTIQLEKSGGSTVHGIISVPSTGGWQNWTTISHNVTLDAGAQQLAIYVPAGGYNLNYFEIFEGANKSAEIAAENNQTELCPKIYPNPASKGIITLTGIEDGKATLNVYALNGTLIHSQELNGPGAVDLNIPTGVYFISINSEKINYTERLLVE